MKKIKFITILLAFICLFSVGCSSSENKNDVLVKEYSGDFTLCMILDEGFYVPAISGWVALSDIPDKITAICASEKFDLEIKSVNRTKDLYIVHFKQEHIFNSLTEKEYSVNLIIKIDGAEFELKNFDRFKVTDDYSSMMLCDLETGKITEVMDKDGNWVGPF